MHRSFADWVNDVIVTAKGRYHDTLKAWGSAIDQINHAATKPVICDMVALAFNTPPAQVISAELFRDAFKAKDVGFSVKNDYALQVLSGAALLTLLHEESTTDHLFELQCLAATAVLAASFAGTRTGYRPDELVQTATDFVNREGLRRREIQRVSFKGDAHALQLAQRKLRASSRSGNAPTADQIKQFNLIVAPTLELLPQIPTLLRNQDILQEESEMAWWVLAGFSRSTERALRNLESAFLPIVVGFELADRTRVFPSGVAARHLIAHVLHTAGQEDGAISLHTLAGNLSDNWAQTVLKTFPPIGPAITPVLYLLQQHSMRGDKWVEQFQTLTGMDPTRDLQASHLGYTFYQECLASRLRGDA